MKNIKIIVIINIISVTLLVLIPLFVSLPLCFGIDLYIFIIDAITSEFLFKKYILQFPLNDYQEYKIELDYLSQYDSIYVEKNEKVFYCHVGDTKLVFDMTGCISPITVIRAYFIRQFLFEYSRVNKIPPEYLIWNHKVYNLPYNLILYYKRKKYYLIRNGKTRQKIYARQINSYIFKPFVPNRWGGGELPTYYKLNENDVASKKNLSDHYRSFRKELKMQKIAEKNRRRNVKRKKKLKKEAAKKPKI